MIKSLIRLVNTNFQMGLFLQEQNLNLNLRTLNNNDNIDP